MKKAGTEIEFNPRFTLILTGSDLTLVLRALRKMEKDTEARELGERLYAAREARIKTYIQTISDSEKAELAKSSEGK